MVIHVEIYSKSHDLSSSQVFISSSGETNVFEQKLEIWDNLKLGDSDY